MSPAQLPALNDDRVGRCLDRLFDADIPTLTLAVVVHAVREFAVDLDELHNDSTTITFHGDYETADQERTLRGRLRLAVTWGHNKDHRPDLKQLLYILTVTRNGAVPVQFRVQSGNATDDRSHVATWDLLGKLTGRRDFLYVADCKLATAENMAYIHRHGGRFLSVLPRTRGEDAAFRAAILTGRVHWRAIHDKYDDEGELVNRFSIHEPEVTSVEGYRLLWYHSTRKARVDALARQHRIERAVSRLAELRERLASPRTRHRERAKVAAAVETILGETRTEGEIEVTIKERSEETFRQGRRGRPNAETPYVKSERKRFELNCRVNAARLAEDASGDGIFPLITNEKTMSAKELLLAYKHQPMIKKRFAAQDGLRGGSGVSEGGESDSGIALRVLSGVAGGVAAGAGVEASDGERGDGEPAPIPGGSGVPPADGPESDRPVRGHPTARVVGGPLPVRSVHHEIEPVATSNPPAPEDERGLRQLTWIRAPTEIRRYAARDVRKVGFMAVLRLLSCSALIGKNSPTGVLHVEMSASDSAPP